MKAAEAAEVFEQLGTLLDLKGENQFKVRAFHNGARILRGVQADFSVFVEDVRSGKVKGFGPQLTECLCTLVDTGRLRLLDELLEELPPGLLELLQLPGLGSKRVKTLYEASIETISGLKDACRSGALLQLPGFGEKTVENILLGIARFEAYRSKYRFDRAEFDAREMAVHINTIDPTCKVYISGGIRRRDETISDITLIVSDSASEKLASALTTAPLIKAVKSQGESGAHAVLKTGIELELRCVSEADSAAALLWTTGSEEHIRILQDRSASRGLALTEKGLVRNGMQEHPASERDIYSLLGLTFIPPEAREACGEIEIAEKCYASGDDYPPLVRESDIRGVLHVHSTYSDGANSIEEMAWAAKRKGYEYLGIADHSQSARYAGGLDVDAIRRQHEEIDRLNEKLAPFRIFKGIESDILSDGSLDYTDAVLASFDFVIASVHSVHRMPKREMTKRIITAMENEHTTILGHPTGRLLLKREPYEVDMDALLDAAAHFNVAIELNANPRRLELEWRYHARAKELGIPIPICPDAHSVEGLECVHYGVGIARKGGLLARDVLTTWTTEEVAEYFKKRRTGVPF